MNNYTNPVTVTGNPASFEASGSGKLLSLSVPFSPIQDLHGYANPWPAGGGKNLYDASIITGQGSAGNNGVVCTVSNGVINLNGTATSNAYFVVGELHLPSGNYAISVNNPSGTNGVRIALRDENGNYYSDLGLSQTNYKFLVSSRDLNMVIIYVKQGTQLTNFKLQPQVEVGTAATSWSPYSNICPISGRTGLSVYVGPTTSQADATTYAVDWTSEAGTVYGGTLDVVTGVLTVDKKYFTQSGDVLLYGNWGHDNAPLYYFLIDTTIPIKVYADTQGDGYILTNYFSANTGSGPELMKNNEIRTRDNTPDRLYFRWDSAGSLADINAAFAENPLQIVAELATPLTYQLTATQVELLIGQNNVWSDSNEAVTLTYVIELFTRYTFIVNGNDYTGLVERDSYRTAVTPVYGETIQTLDGVGHTALLRVKGSLTVKLNPQTAAQTAAICADLLNAPCEVQYKCLQRNVNVTALMVLDAVSAMFLSRCLYLGQKWNDVDEIVLKEL